MTLREGKIAVRSKLWIEDEAGNILFGMGRVKILKSIKSLGSINAAAKELKMSYRGLWGRIKATEERLGQPLLLKNTGGVSGGGSRLTPFAESLIAKFEALHRKILKESDDAFKTLLKSLKEK